MKLVVILATVAPLIIGGGTAIGDQRLPCKGSPNIMGECFTVHGRVGAYNGIPMRMWVVGTHRMLNVVEATELNDDENSAIPASVGTLMALGRPQEIVVFGDYEVCPLEKDQPGRMRAVCIESASNLVAAKWNGTVVRPR